MGASTRFVCRCRSNALQTTQKKSNKLALGLVEPSAARIRKKYDIFREPVFLRIPCVTFFAANEAAEIQKNLSIISFGNRIFRESPMRLLSHFSRENLWRPRIFLILQCEFFRGTKEVVIQKKKCGYLPLPHFRLHVG